ncbi:protein broad-minded-like [Prorops nasuta]|uniref:protein broad-minded-like n=1 Tax=Prorops nasuta TaxID=863751 RepID=UPI0034CEEBAD
MDLKKRLSPDIQRWLRECVKKEFRVIIEQELEEDQECSDIAKKLIDSPAMSTLLDSMKKLLIEEFSTSPNESRPQTSLSFSSDLIADDWNTPKEINDFSLIIDQISCDKPVHVRLAGYESLLKSDLTAACSSPIWDFLQKTLRDNLTDESRPIFDVSLQVHAKLLSSLKTQEVYSNLLGAFSDQYRVKEPHETLPTLISGINFKIFAHEKLFRIMNLIIMYQEEALKAVRTVDKNVEDTIEQFIIFLSTDTLDSSLHPKTLDTLNILSILEPQAYWSKRWNHSQITRKVFMNNLAKSPSFLHRMIECVEKGFQDIPTITSVSIYDDPMEVCITGDTVKTVTFLHCLTFLSQTSSYHAGRMLLFESAQDKFSVPDFIIALVHSLNRLTCTVIVNGVYNTCRNALKIILNGPQILYDSRLYEVALKPLMESSESVIKILPHTFDVIMHMLDTTDGSLYVINASSDSNENSSIESENSSPCAAILITEYISKLLTQPFSVMNVEYVLTLFKILDKLFDSFETYEIILRVIVIKFYSALSGFYKKLDKYFVENEGKTQQLDSGIKKLLLKIVSVPFCLQAMARRKILFEEVIRGCIAPLRASWTSSEVVSFVSSAAFFDSGYKILQDLSPHVLSTFLSETCKVLEDPKQFYDPWNDENMDKFLHVFALFSLNLRCITAFTTASEEVEDDENEYPHTVTTLLRQSVNYDSPYHYLGLNCLNVMIWNLDIHIFLLHLLDFQAELLKFQGYCMIENEHEKGIGSETEVEYLIDECGFLRHKILCNSYYVERHKKEYAPDECNFFSEFPQKPVEELKDPEDDYDDELELLLMDDKPGFRDASWVSQAINAYRNMSNPLKESILIHLLEQMETAVPTTEWGEDFIWQNINFDNSSYWLPEEIHGFQLVLRFAEENEIMKNTDENIELLKEFIQASYGFIRYKRSNCFEGFDWFLATVFILCKGQVEKCKQALTQLMKFPTIIFMWGSLGKVLDENSAEERNTQFVFLQLLESITSTEFPQIQYALKTNYGISWWQVISAAMTQLFWGILPWNEIKYYFALCILYPPDYMLYYCVSLLHHCQHILMRDIANGKMWPENLALDNFRCHDNLALMDNLEKRYRNKVLPLMTPIQYAENEAVN